MAKNPMFELFEILCGELAGKTVPQVIDENGLADDALIADLKRRFRQTDDSAAFAAGVQAIEAHFVAKGGRLPFTVDLPTRTFTPVDADYIDFIAFARSTRGVGGQDSKAFEVRTMQRFRLRVTGDLHRVGAPRDARKRKAEIVSYLEDLGFDDDVFEPHDKDGGLDILWLPPIGSIPLRPIVSVQCKNGSFDEDEAAKSASRAQVTISKHSHLRNNGSMRLVVFNDYIDDSYRGRAAGWVFLPLGLTDLAHPSVNGTDTVL